MRRILAPAALATAAAVAGVVAGTGVAGSQAGNGAAGSQAEAGRSSAGATSSNAAPARHGKRAVVWAVGDLATPGAAADRVAALIRNGKPDRFLYLGDVYETGTLDEFRRWYHPRLGQLARITEATIGNHEWTNRFTGYYKYWARRKGAATAAWSKTRIAGWELINLNSQAAHDPDSAQIKWLERKLEGARGDCRIAFWHRPRFSEGAYGDSATSLDAFWRRLVGRARIVLSGHDHNMQRHEPRGGIRQYIAGAGGRHRYALKRTSPTLAWATDKVDGALRIVLKPGLAVLEFRSPAKRLLDRSRVTCTPG